MSYNTHTGNVCLHVCPLTLLQQHKQTIRTSVCGIVVFVCYQDMQQLLSADLSHKSLGLLLPIDLATLPDTQTHTHSSAANPSHKTVCTDGERK